MSTTIQIRDSTHQMLKKLKDEENASNYDEVISKLAQEKLKIPKSMAGVLREKPVEYNKKEDRLDIDER